MPVLQFGDQTRPVGPGVLTVGSAPEATWRVTGHDLEPIHAIIVPERPGRTLLTAGTKGAQIVVNGKTLEEGISYVLAYGDRIRLGVADLVFRQHARARGAGEPAFLYDRHRDRLYRLDAATTTVGRDVGCGICIQDPEVSRIHAEVTRQTGEASAELGYIIVPKGTVTLINGDRIVAPSPLNEGDEVMVGRTRLRFSWDAPRGTSPVTDASRPAGAKRAASFQTTYVSTLDARQLQLRRSRRQRFRPSTLVIAAAAALGLAVVVGYARVGAPHAGVTAAAGSGPVPIAAEAGTRRPR